MVLRFIRLIPRENLTNSSSAQNQVVVTSSSPLFVFNMVRTSERKKMEHELFHLWLFSVVDQRFNFLAPKAMAAMVAYEAFCQQRYILPIRAIGIAKSNFRTHILPTFTDARFRAFTRMNRSTFNSLVEILSEDEIFHNNSSCPQAPVEEQLLLALHKLGNAGSACTFIKSAGNWATSEGHIHKCTKRVVLALCNLKDERIRWPTAKEKTRESMKNDDRAGFIGCVGKVDGTDCAFYEKPGGDYVGEVFFNRKKRYAMDLCAICDSSNRFTYVYTGWPSSLHDHRVFKTTDIFKHPDAYFTDGQYLLGDKAYMETQEMIIPYIGDVRKQIDNARFNKLLSSIRIDIEHTFGMLKGRWASLTGLRLVFRNEEHYKYICQWIVACCVLHNILLDMTDDWEEEEGWWVEEDEEAHDEEVGGLLTVQRHMGLDKREHMKRIVLGLDGLDD